MKEEPAIPEDCFESTEKLVERLEYLSSYEGTEIGEMWSLLSSLWGRKDCISKELRVVLEDEIKKEAEFLKYHAKLLTGETTYTRNVVNLEFDH